MYCCVDCYALISGYVGYKENTRHNFGSYIRLWLQVVFYGVGILLIMRITGFAPISMKDLLEAFVPVTRNQYWYFTAYTGVFMLAPLINHLIEKTEEKVMQIWVYLGIFGFSFYSTIAQNLGGDPFEVKEGYSFVWLAFLYFLGASIKRYGWDIKIRKYNNYGWKLFIICIACVVITGGWFLICPQFMLLLLGKTWGKHIFLNYVSPTVLSLALCMLFLFSGFIPGKRITTAVKFSAPATFGVYLLHTQHKMIDYVFEDGFLWLADFEGIWSTISVLGISFAILILGILVDRCRMVLFKVCGVDVLVALVNRIDGTYGRRRK